MFDLLQIREKTFVADIAYHDKLESTNSFAIEQIEQSPVTGPWLVLTDRQTAGRGRGTNPWWAAGGALTFSLVIEAQDLNANQICKASLTAGLAVCQAIERFVPGGDLALKWPNDVFLEGKKVCGILIERSPMRPHFLVLGIGINVNNSITNAPSDIASKATSMTDCLGVKMEITAVLIECLQQIDRRIQSIRQGDSTLLNQWRAYCLLTGKKVTIDNYDKVVTGICHGIDEDGALLLLTGDEMRRLMGGVVKRFE